MRRYGVGLWLVGLVSLGVVLGTALAENIELNQWREQSSRRDHAAEIGDLSPQIPKKGTIQRQTKDLERKCFWRLQHMWSCCSQRPIFMFLIFALSVASIIILIAIFQNVQLVVLRKVAELCAAISFKHEYICNDLKTGVYVLNFPLKNLSTDRLIGEVPICALPTTIKLDEGIPVGSNVSYAPAGVKGRVFGLTADYITGEFMKRYFHPNGSHYLNQSALDQPDGMNRNFVLNVWNALYEVNPVEYTNIAHKIIRQGALNMRGHSDDEDGEE
ncbi:hypothetical protein NEHOM01_1463 [Nematocida homosporus]|uniref:uncharacterized protein n=1 Tax=Nematocida homosporus TaxID=1912981 RepID=UPI00221ECDD0|nr:uncharacterized protein NEHOM01_1463 [Nematocida homosporus]KAI5186430.1 hypothetical protein NEHOM01_1463 [Nematocida homosporus]